MTRILTSPGQRNAERGGGYLKVIIWMAVLGLLVYLAVKIVPAYVNNYSLHETMKEQARFAKIRRLTPEQMRENVYTKIQELGVPAGREDIRVDPIVDGFRISVRYTVEIPLPGYTMRLNFNPVADPRTI